MMIKATMDEYTLVCRDMTRTTRMTKVFEYDTLEECLSHIARWAWAHAPFAPSDSRVCLNIEDMTIVA